MSELRVIARCVARDGKEDELREALQSMLKPTRLEPGSDIYDLYESDHKGRFYFYERWRDQEAFDQHTVSSHFKQLVETVKDLLNEPLEVNLVTQIGND